MLQDSCIKANNSEKIQFIMFIPIAIAKFIYYAQASSKLVHIYENYS